VIAGSSILAGVLADPADEPLGGKPCVCFQQSRGCRLSCRYPTRDRSGLVGAAECYGQSVWRRRRLPYSYGSGNSRSHADL